MPNIKRIAILFQSFCFFHITIAKQNDDDINNSKLMNVEKSQTQVDIELQRISQEVNEINKNFEIIKLKQEKNIKNNTYKDFLTANSELEKLKISLQKISQEIEKQDLKNDIESKKEELSEKSNVKKNILKKERLKNIQEQKKLAEELSVKIQILTLKIDIMYKENELSNLEYFQKRNKNVKKMDRIRVKNCN